jgi:hypothetical protein
MCVYCLGGGETRRVCMYVCSAACPSRTAIDVHVCCIYVVCMFVYLLDLINKVKSRNQACICVVVSFHREECECAAFSLRTRSFEWHMSREYPC